jgi:acyl-CoA-dependent ceramide synthase
MKGKAPSKPPTQSRNSDSSMNMNRPLYMQTANNKIIIRKLKRKRKDDSLLKNLARWLLDNQTGTSAGRSSLSGPSGDMAGA